MSLNIRDVALEGTDGDTQRQIIPPQGIRLGPGCRIGLAARASIAITLTLRFTVYSGGRYLNSSLQLIPPTDRTLGTVVEGISGVLINCAVRCDLSAPIRGQCFAQIYVQRDGDTNTILSSGYVEAMIAPSWPNGPMESSQSGNGLLVTVDLGDPAANTDYANIAVPNQAVWRVLSFRGQLVTDANVANRFFEIDYTNSGLPMGGAGSGVAQPASTQINYRGGIGQNTPTFAALVTGQYVFFGMPDMRIPKGGGALAFHTINFQATDNWAQGNLQVEEWIVPA